MSISIFGLLHSVILTRALFAAAELNIAEQLDQVSMTADELAIVFKVDCAALKRLLYFLELNDVFTKQANGKYGLTTFSQTMLGSHPQTIKPFLLHDDETRWNSFGHLGYAIKTGKSSFEKLYQTDYFSYLKDEPVLNMRFNQAMEIISSQEDQLITQKIDFEKTVADVGGGVGQLINQIAQTGKIDHGILFDLPVVVAQASNLNIVCTKQGGSFFEPLHLSADIFILKRILHDWDDQAALIILKNVTASMSASSKLYIIDGVIDYAQDKKTLAAIDLALLTIFQGQERTSVDFQKLIDLAGLKLIKIEPLNDLISIIECVKK